ncbi:unnamed protein product [Strongylus vulgaris]|uniref:RRM domain-containing protein n=1 Tax=Strongylus vulgaris TaxID=40348 RepID=A0A3P7KBZ5_STRVU|nr:unnamed protein product [Strongylus vulgaris]
MHTLVRFENAADAESVIARDGEQGIRVRQSTKAVFDEAVDGIPPAIISVSHFSPISFFLLLHQVKISFF